VDDGSAQALPRRERAGDAGDAEDLASRSGNYARAPNHEANDPGALEAVAAVIIPAKREDLQ
jgi:hypothetical protein